MTDHEATPDSMIQAVILAAGSSSRMGQPKQLLRVNGEYMLDRTISIARKAGFARPVLVLGACAGEICQKSKLVNLCEIVVNSQHEKGQSSSLITGVRHILGTCDGALFMLCDQPFLSAELIGKLAGAFTSRRPDLLYPVYRKQRGNPVILSRSVFPKLLNASGDQGARFLFQDTTLSSVAYDVDDPAILIDIDTPAEYEKYCSGAKINK